MVISKDEYRKLMNVMVEKSLTSCIEKTDGFLNKMIPTDQMRESGFNINSKSDFAKGFCISAFYTTTNFVSEFYPQSLKPLLEQLQEEYSKKILDYYDFIH